MKYSTKDYLGELCHYYGASNLKQQLNTTIDEYTLIGHEQDSQNIEERFQFLLELNDYNRVGHNTHFKLHKGYPSPRSLYPLKLFLCLGEHHYLSKDDIENVYEYYNHSLIKSNKGDLHISFRDIYLENYQYIKKTLLLLEIGHLLFNVIYTANVLGLYYKPHVKDDDIYLELIDEERLNEVNRSVLNIFKQKSMNRNSGKYLIPITEPELFVLDRLEEYNQLLELELSRIEVFFGNYKLKKHIRVITYVNNGQGSFNSSKSEEEEEITIGYKELNKIYPYVNFIGVTFFAVFLLENEVFKYENAIEFILSLGYLSQSISIQYSNQDQFCRPIKSFNMNDLETLFSIDNTKYTAFYCLLSGSNIKKRMR